MGLNFVFLHGGGQGGWVWDEAIAAIAAQSGGMARCLALDVPGCGAKRGRDTAAIAFPDIVAELSAEVAASGLRDIVLVGHSQAGTVLPGLLAARPDLYARVVWVSITAPDPGVTILEQTDERVHGNAATPGGRAYTDPDLPWAERFRIMFCNDMPPAQAEAFLGKLGQDQWPASSYGFRDWQYDHLADVDGSFVLCLQDAILPPEWQRRYAERVRARRIVSLDCGHQAMNTRPQALAEVLLAEARR